MSGNSTKKYLMFVYIFFLLTLSRLLQFDFNFYNIFQLLTFSILAISIIFFIKR